MKLLSKIQEAKWIDDMYAREYLYFSVLQNFRKESTDISGRDDPRELNLANWQLKSNSKLELMKDGKEFFSATLKSGIITEYPIEAKVNCCSLHWIHLKENESPESLDSRLFGLGDKILLIYDIQKFLTSLVRSLEILNFRHDRDSIEYYNPHTYNGELTPFHKDQKLSFQNEYRILVYSNSTEGLKIDVPGLKKFSKILDMKSYANLRISLG